MEVIKNTNNETIVKISGRWDTTNVSEYGKELEQILGKCCHCHHF